MPDAALRLSPLRVSALTVTEGAAAVEVCCLAEDASGLSPQDVYLLDPSDLTQDLALYRGIVLTQAGEGRARELLAAGASCVLLGEAALRNPDVIETLSREFGRERIGVHVPATRMQVSWSMDTVSNADFKVMRPSVCEPNWEVQMADGSRTGVYAPWWIEEMMKRGAGPVMVRVDIEDDADLNLCAGLVEQCGERLWLAPLTRQPAQVSDWIEYGHARRLAFPRHAYEQHDAVLALRVPAARDEQRPKETV